VLTKKIKLMARFGIRMIKATFTQKHNSVVSSVFESLIQLCSVFTHSSIIYEGDNRINQTIFSRLTTAFTEKPALFEQNRNGQLVVCHLIQCEKAVLQCTNTCLQCVAVLMWFR